MKIQNKHIKSLGDFLFDIDELPAKQSRMKSKFIRLAQSELDEISKQQEELLKMYAEKDENGEIKKIKEGENTRVQLKDVEAYAKGINELDEEYWIVEENESNKDMLLKLKDIVLNYEGRVKKEHSFAHEAICDAVEELSYEQEAEEDKDNE